MVGNQCLIVCFVISPKIPGYHVCLQEGVFFCSVGNFFVPQSSATICEAVCYISMPNTETSLLQGELEDPGGVQCKGKHKPASQQSAILH